MINEEKDFDHVAEESLRVVYMEKKMRQKRETFFLHFYHQR